MKIFYLIAIVIFFTSAYTATAGNEAAIRRIIKQLRVERTRAHKGKPWQDITSGQTLSEDIVKTSNRMVSEPAPGITREAIFQLLELPNGEPMGDAEIRLMRAYHACVFERLKFFFLGLQESPGVPQEMLGIIHAEISLHFRLANEFTEVCSYRKCMYKLDMLPHSSTGGHNIPHAIGHVEPCVIHPKYAEMYEQASTIIGRRLGEFIKGIMTCIECLQVGDPQDLLQ
ncbi:hypothetical protein SeLEV6574_g08119 [Synchytrium endobioticum]|uniref:Uncharacterized protein n=1 Tax=Synchytrium endobioticum TaxID=286115 RepID=A0A507C501_9FUNG|nr:hypothetical protein SeLEV6574_g08119 [Synchytrium endobioticum]